MATRTKKPKQWDPVEVEWLDAKSWYGDSTLGTAEKYQPARRRSLGYYITGDDDRLVIASTDDRGADMDTHVADTLVLPSPWVLVVTPLLREE